MIVRMGSYGSSADDSRTGDLPTTEDVGMVVLDAPPARVPASDEPPLGPNPALAGGGPPAAPSRFPAWMFAAGAAAVGLGIAAAYVGGRS